MRYFEFNYNESADDVILHPADIAILVFAAERLPHTLTRPTEDNMPYDLTQSMYNTTAWRVNRLIEAARKCRISDDGQKLIVPMRCGDRHYFAQVLYGYLSGARAIVWMHDKTCDTTEEKKQRDAQLYTYFGDLYRRLGGSEWHEKPSCE